MQGILYFCSMATKTETEINKANLIIALERYNLQIGKACDFVGVSRNVFHDWKKSDNAFLESVNELWQKEKEFAETRHKLLRNGIPLLSDSEDKDSEVKEWIEKPDIRALDNFLARKNPFKPDQKTLAGIEAHQVSRVYVETLHSL
ncbi:unnamed protein product, partial [marine sediment metagenome]